MTAIRSSSQALDESSAASSCDQWEETPCSDDESVEELSAGSSIVLVAARSAETIETEKDTLSSIWDTWSDFMLESLTPLVYVRDTKVSCRDKILIIPRRRRAMEERKVFTPFLTTRPHEPSPYSRLPVILVAVLDYAYFLYILCLCQPTQTSEEGSRTPSSSTSYSPPGSQSHVEHRHHGNRTLAPRVKGNRLRSFSDLDYAIEESPRMALLPSIPPAFISVKHHHHHRHLATAVDSNPMHDIDGRKVFITRRASRWDHIPHLSQSYSADISRHSHRSLYDSRDPIRSHNSHDDGTLVRESA